MKKVKKIWIAAAVTLAVMLLTGSLIGPILSNVPTPDYQVISSEKEIEIRSYQPMIIAEVKVKGERREAIRAGFRILADFIFGNNTVQEKIAMTAPVQQKLNEKIAMTAPVQQEAKGNLWMVSFIMPSEYTMQSLPKPNDERVLLRQVPARKLIAIQFSGRNTDANLKEHEKRLMEHIKAKNIKVLGPARYAFYNAPWTLPFLRRNEIMLETLE